MHLTLHEGCFGALLFSSLSVCIGWSAVGRISLERTCCAASWGIFYGSW